MSLALHLHVRVVHALYAAAAGQGSWKASLEALLLLGWHSTYARRAQLVDAVGHVSRALSVHKDPDAAAGSAALALAVCVEPDESPAPGTQERRGPSR